MNNNDNNTVLYTNVNLMFCIHKSIVNMVTATINQINYTVL